MTDAPIKTEYDPSNLDAPTLNVIELQGVTKKFGAKSALNDVSFSVKPGSVFALLGENGAGKTTTIRMTLGEMKPDSGAIRVFQLDPTKRLSEIRQRIGFVPEFPALYEYMTVAEQGRFAAAFYPKGYMERYAKLCLEFQLSPKDKINNLSKGMKAKASLALALAHDPDLLVLDEPTSGLDTLVRRQFLEQIADLAATGKTIFMSSHQTSEVERVADHVAFLKDGKAILVESLDQLKETTRLISATIVSQSDARLDTLFASLFNDELVSVERYGARYRIVGRNLNARYAEQLKAALGKNLTDLEVLRPSLEEIFIAYMN